MEYKVQIKTESPLCLNSGKADVNIDTDIVHDAFGLPYFPGKRLRGLLYESAVEVVEMAELCQKSFVTRRTVEELFHRCADSTVELIIPDFQLEDYPEMAAEWQYLQKAYGDLIRPESVLETYASIRFQTALDEDGIAKETSLRNIRVLDAPLTFVGKIQVNGGEEKHFQALALALANLRRAGMNRNRGFGRICCSMEEGDALLAQVFSEGGRK
ncbi:RAMP superfamily CRISPR-associated protein [uncultured Megasphaera sp.]|uniref:RAMP superfamily CRISPR-associated protein n=1 Tax=uncultured Megasphaera sp. TaxID=165188 RepID=UPI0025D8F69B|nr:RAMP superfamily CRISPR-associated protein [uncultured Megasphaera sp.]